MANYQGILHCIGSVWLQMEANGVVYRDYGCTEHTYATTKQSEKYAQVRFKGTKYYCHIVAAMYSLRRAPLPGEEASHLCGNPRCIEPSHLTFESGGINRSRWCCHMYLGVDLYDDLVYVCPHQPKCLE